MNADLDICCPLCGDSLSLEGPSYNCASCDRTYPIELGIPDFRTPHLTGIDRAEDLDKARFLAARADRLTFEELLRTYWESMPEITPERATHFTRRALALVDKGSSSIAEIDHVSRSRHPLSYGSVLEIGCGTGGFLLAGSEKFDRVIGTDLSMAWLVIARKRLEERGVEGFLACAGAEHLPFRSGAFDLVVAEDVIEHVQDQERTMQECARVLGKAGILFLATPNRFSFTPEPHVGLWGVGFLPRRWMSRYVRWARGVTYDDIRIVSYFELTGLLSRARFKNYHVVLPALNADEVSGFSPLKRRLVPLYDFLRGQPVFRPFLLVSGPFFHVFGYGGERPAS